MSDHHCIPECTEQDHIADTGRHPKWQRVDPGTVIPAGQPYRVEYEQEDDRDFEVMDSVDSASWFIDSSWKPPLVLPTEPTWGIAVNKIVGASFGRWVAESIGTIYDDHNQRSLTQGLTTDFIPLTDEQVARIEAAR